MRLRDNFIIEGNLTINTLSNAVSNNYTALFIENGVVTKKTLGNIIGYNLTDVLISIGYDLPSIFNPGSPITPLNSNVKFTLVNQPINTFFAAPAIGTGTPSFRKITASDLVGTGVLFEETDPKGVKGIAFTGTTTKTLTITLNDNTTQSATFSDIDTTYAPGTLALLNSGTDTLSRVWSSKDLADYVKSKATLDTITRLRGTATGTYTSGDLTLLAGANTAITQSGANITIASTNTNTTYTAGNGLTLSGTVFSITKATATGSGNVVSDYNVTSTGIQLVKGITAMETSHVANGITSTNIANWNLAFTNRHTHSNKDVLDDITSTLVTKWNTVTEKEDRWTSSGRDFADGTLITTNINYSVAQGSEFLLEIKGNTYGSNLPADIKIQGYIYDSTIINTTGYTTYDQLNKITALNNNGFLCFWFPRIAYWQGFFARISTNNQTQAKVTEITNSIDPVGTKRVEINLQVIATETWVNSNYIPKTHVINEITSTNISNWNSAESNAITKSRASLITSTSATGTSNIATTNTNTFLNIIQNGTSIGSSSQVTGAGSVTVSSDASGKITINGTNTTYSTETLANLNIGASTTGLLQSAKNLNDWIDTKRFLSSKNTYLFPETLYNFSNGYLVRTNIPDTASAMFVLSIVGNSYAGTPIDTIVEGYNYPTSNAIFSTSAINNGYKITSVSAFNYEGFVCFHVPFMRSSQSFQFELTVGNLQGYIITSVTNEVKPLTGVTRNVDIIPTNKVSENRSLIAGNGLSGGGNLTSDRILVLETPSAITLSSTNSVTTSSHTHAFTPGGTAAQYIRGDGSLATYVNTTYTAGNGISLIGTNFTPTYGTTANTITQGNDARINNGQTAFEWGNHALAGYLTSANVGNFFEKESINSSSNVNSLTLGLFTVVPTTLNLPTEDYGIVYCYKANTTWWFQQFKSTSGVIWERMAINPSTADSWNPWIKINANSSIDNYAQLSQIPTVNNGQLTLSTGTGLSGSGSFTANQAGSSIFSVAVASTHKLPTVTEWNSLKSDSYPLVDGNGINDYNTIRVPGRYYITDDALQQQKLNRPSDFSGVLEVIFGDNDWCFQRFTEYAGTQTVFHRKFYNGIWSSWIIEWNSNHFHPVNKANIDGSNTTGGTWNINAINSPQLLLESGNGQIFNAVGNTIYWGNPSVQFHTFEASNVDALGFYVPSRGRETIWHGHNFDPNSKANTVGNYQGLIVGNSTTWNGQSYKSVEFTGTPNWLLTYDTSTDSWYPTSNITVSNWLRPHINKINPTGLKEATYGNYFGVVQEVSSDNPTNDWYNRIKILHNNNAGYFTELAQGFDSNGIFYRSTFHGQTSNWTKLWDKNDFNDTRVSNWDIAYNSIGFPLANLTTTDKTSLVGAVNEVNNIQIGGRNDFLNSKDERSYTNTSPLPIAAFELNTEYTISFDAKIINGSPLFHVEFNGGIKAKDFTLTNDYVRYSHTLSTGNVYGTLYFWLLSSGEVSLKNIKVEKGNKATDWTPAPEDQVSDWNETDSTKFSFIKNKPAIINVNNGTFNQLSINPNGGNVVIGSNALHDDSKLVISSGDSIDSGNNAYFPQNTKLALLNGNVYGTLFYTTGDGSGHIQQQRVDGNPVAYTLNLNPKGGLVTIGSVNKSYNTNVLVTYGRIQTVGTESNSVTHFTNTAVDNIVSGTEYKWYNDTWSIGNVRGGNFYSEGFGFYFNGIRQITLGTNGQINSAIHGNSSQWKSAFDSWSTKGTINLNSVIANGFYREENPAGAYPFTTTLNMNSFDGRQQLQIDRGGNGIRFRASLYNNGTDWNEWKSVKTGHTRTVVVNNLSSNKFVGLRFARFGIGPCKVIVTVQGNWAHSNIGGSSLVKEYCFHDNGDKNFHSQSYRSISAYGTIAEAYRLSDGVYWNGSGEISCNLHGLPSASSGNPLKITIDYYLYDEKNFELIHAHATDEIDDTSGIGRDKELALNDGSNTTGGNWNIHAINSPQLLLESGNGQIFNAVGTTIYWGNPSVQFHTFEASNVDALGFYVPSRGRETIWHGHNFDPNSKVNINGDNATGNWNIYSRGIYGAAESDFWRIQGNVPSANNIELELATADDATEAIVARQYSGTFTTITREAYILDSSGNTSFPGNVRASTFRMTGMTTTPAGVVSTESSIWQLGNDYGYGISMNQGGGLDIMANQPNQPIRLWSGQANANPYNSITINGSRVDVYGTIFTSSYYTSAEWKQAYDWGNHKSIDTHQYLGATYVGGGIRKPNDFGAGRLKLEMVNGSVLGVNDTWNDVLWLSSYSGGDVKSSNAIIISKYNDEIGFSRQSFDSETWGTYRRIWHSGNLDINNYVDKTSEQVITGRKIFNSGISNAYTGTALQVMGNGSNAYPGVSFHQPGSYAGSILMTPSNDFLFCDGSSNNVVNIRIKQLNSNSIATNQYESGDGIGISLYGDYSGTTRPTYGLMFALSSNYSPHGYATGGWNTYFVNEASDYGWIFRSSYGNIASISATGRGTFADLTADKLNNLKILGRASFGTTDILNTGGGLNQNIFGSNTQRDGIATFRSETTLGGGIIQTYGTSMIVQSLDTMFTLSVNPSSDIVYISGGSNANNIKWNRRLAFTENNVQLNAPGFENTSLRKLKTNIKPFEKSGLDLINSLDIVTFDRKDTKQKNVIGIIADDTSSEFLNKNHDAVDLYKTIFIQAKAIQELSDKVDKLTELVNKLAEQ